MGGVEPLWIGRVRFIAIAVILVTASAGLGIVFGKLYERSNKEKFVTSRRYATQSLVKHMGTLSVNSDLPDSIFLDELDRQVRLSVAVPKAALLIFVDPDCGTCLEEIENLYAANKELDLAGKVIVITKSDAPLTDWIDPNRLPDVRVLKDADGSYHAALNVQAIPFSILVGPDLRIADFFSGLILTSEYDEILMKIDELNK